MYYADGQRRGRRGGPTDVQRRYQNRRLPSLSRPALVGAMSAMAVGCVAITVAIVALEEVVLYKRVPRRAVFPRSSDGRNSGVFVCSVTLEFE